MDKIHRDYELCKLLHCTPKELDEQEARILDLYREFYQKENKQQKIEQKRDEQKRKHLRS